MIFGQVSFPDETCANKFLRLYKIRYFEKFCYIILEFQYIENSTSAFANPKNPFVYCNGVSLDDFGLETRDTIKRISKLILRFWKRSPRLYVCG